MTHRPSVLVAALTLSGAATLFACRPAPQPDVEVRPIGSVVDSGQTVTVTGRVRDASSGKPLGGAHVLLANTAIGAITDDSGRYKIVGAPAGTHTLVVRRIGFDHVTLPGLSVRAGATVAVDVKLAASTAMLHRVVTTGAETSTDKRALGSQAAPASPAVPVATAQSVVNELAASGRVAGFSVVERELAEADELVVLSRGRMEEAKAYGPARRADVVHKDGRGLRTHPRTRAQDLGPPATQGVLRARNAEGAIIGEFPLRHTEATAEVSGYLARTTVEQRYENRFTEPIEAVYVFPLPALSAVNDFVMQVGARKIVGVVRPREEAERIYRDARMRGQTASLLTQERPNIFTQNVANIEAGGSVTITITYFERLAYEHGQYEYVFPMVVGPRYVSGRMLATGAGAQHVSGGVAPRESGGGWAPATDRVPDADRVTPPVLKPGQRSGHDINVTVSLDAGLPVTQLAVPTHRVEVERASPARRVIRLAPSDSIPNRDFVLRWNVGGAETQFGVLAHRARAGGFFTLTMQPPLGPRDEQVTPREITFILDVSGSMTGFPLDIGKDVVRQTLDRMRPEDRFNLVYFSGGNAQLWESAQPRTAANVAAAKQFLENLRAGGGTEMLAGLRRALGARHDPKYLQMYVFVTDGFVAEEAGILTAVKEERGDARFFGFGIGSSVNRYLLEQIGEQGGGATEIVIPRDSSAVRSAVRRLFDAIDSPVLVDIAVDWNGLPVADVYPATIRDLFAGRTINVIGRYTGAARGIAYVTGRVGSRRVRYPVRIDLPEASAANAALAPTWARGRIAELSATMLTADTPRRADLEREITSLAVEHRLVSQYTAFVAVDESRVVGGGRPLRVMQPVELPEGVSYEGIFGGERPVGQPMRIGAWGMTLQETSAGAVRVGEITPGGPGARAGVGRGALLKAVAGSPVHTVAELESMLLQSGRSGVTVRLAPGGEVTLPTP